MRGAWAAEAGIDFRLPPSHLGQASELDDSRFGGGLGRMRIYGGDVAAGISSVSSSLTSCRS